MSTSNKLPDQTFPRDSRLLNAAEFSKVFKKSRRRANQYWSVLFHETGVSANSCSKMGLAIAKKRARRAVDRNRIKRTAREQFRVNRHALSGYHLVVMNRDAATSATGKQLRESLQSLFSDHIRADSKPTDTANE